MLCSREGTAPDVIYYIGFTLKNTHFLYCIIRYKSVIIEKTLSISASRVKYIQRFQIENNCNRK